MFLPIIGKNWLKISDDTGKPRIYDKQDVLRREIALALNEEIAIVPILFQDAKMPSDKNLPKDIKELARYQGIHFRHSSFDDDLQELLIRLDDIVYEKEEEEEEEEEENKGEEEVDELYKELLGSIMGSATPNVLLHQVKRPKRPSHKALEKSGLYSKLPKVADAVIRAELLGDNEDGWLFRCVMTASCDAVFRAWRHEIYCFSNTYRRRVLSLYNL